MRPQGAPTLDDVVLQGAAESIVLVPRPSYRSDHHSCSVEDEARVTSALLRAHNDPVAMAQLRKLAERSIGRGQGSLDNHAVTQAVAVAVRSRWIYAFETEAEVRARWQRYIANLPLHPPHDRGALWSKVGAWQTAAELARKDNRVTLEMLLSGSTGFFGRYEKDFGPRMTATTGLVWQWLSRRYAAQLSGSVVAYVNDAALAAHIGSIGRAGKPEDALPQLTAELEEIADVMRENPTITSIAVKDARTGITGFMTPQGVARAAARPH